MKYLDVLYGEQVIDEGWVIDVINHPVFLRLKGVNQYGFMKPFHPEAKTSRFEHSIGVFLLLKEYDLSQKEQLSGLMHDISHTVFSHSIDYALNAEKAELQDYQDSTHEDYIQKSGIKDILKEHNFSVQDVVDYHKYPALEKELPDLCADRIDYILRDSLAFGVINGGKVKNILESLKFKDDIWFFDDVKMAREFALLFKKMNNDFYAAPWTGFMHWSVGAYVKEALLKGYIKKNDLYLTDEEVVKKINLNLSKDEKLTILWQRLNGANFSLDKNDYDFLVKTKSRIVDPFVRVYGEIKRYSEIDKIWKKVVEEEVKPKEYFIKYV